jgi:RNA polymerase sigma-70 factor, ECF subfamily
MFASDASLQFATSMRVLPFSRRTRVQARSGEESSRAEALSGPASGGRGETFEQLALPLLPSLYNQACWFTRNHAEAEDLVQETISKAIRAFGSFAPGTNFKAWMMRILRNTFLTSRTGMAASHTLFLEDHPQLLETMHTADLAPDPEETLIRLDNQALVQDALERLEPPLREVLLLCDVEELKYKEIAGILDIPIGTVMSRISRARRALRRLLESGPETGSAPWLGGSR